MSREHFFHLPINPEPWAMGPVGVRRTKTGAMGAYVGRNQQLHAYKEAIRAEMKDATRLPPGQYELFFYFWRQIASYEDSEGARRHRNVVDATNMQKATEDALQGFLIDNDRNVKRVGSCVVDEGPNVTGQILIRASTWGGLNPDELPDFAWSMVDYTHADNIFTEAEDPFA